jgi:hypothetical protein
MQHDGALGLEGDGQGAVVLRALGLWLDPPSARPAAFVSHAHAFAALESERAYASPETLSLARALGASAGGEAIRWEGAIELPILPEYGGGTARLTLAPAGHLLGAAQLVIDHPRGRFVYTGDFGAEGDATHAGGTIVACDELAVTCTFALPIFRFAPSAPVVEAVITWCGEELAAKKTPVVLAQQPGPAQAILVGLAARQMRAVVSDDVAASCRVYEASGVRFGELLPYAAGGGGEVFVASARTKRADIRPKGRASFAYASAWATLDAMVEQKRADAAFVLANQADSDALVSLVESTGARIIHAVYGDARAFALLLRSREPGAVRAWETPSIDARSGM